MKTLILYSTHDGQTKKIASFIANMIKENVEVKSIHDEFDLQAYIVL